MSWLIWEFCFDRTRCNCWAFRTIFDFSCTKGKFFSACQATIQHISFFFDLFMQSSVIAKSFAYWFFELFKTQAWSLRTIWFIPAQIDSDCTTEGLMPQKFDWVVSCNRPKLAQRNQWCWTIFGAVASPFWDTEERAAKFRKLYLHEKPNLSMRICRHCSFYKFISKND